MNYLKSDKFKYFTSKTLDKNYKGKEKRDLEKEINQKIGTREFVLAKIFYAIIKQLGLNIDETCLILLPIAQSLPDLNLFPNKENKLNSFISTYSKELKEIADSAGIEYNRFIKLHNGEYSNLYPNDVNGLAIAFNILPSQLFEYFYGDGERPMIGLFPKPSDGDASEG
ncbi:hypothetical protein KO02_05295 [Sphingobacterium sp. ML3W]|uniref:hypothetical protein n=1 Tax=Sphingobacterium sp. ML3W TaxID=1538644 RepID=UPI0004F7519E|nr:hypothetical protein [Sphingobacterium sp. ML3W]AIM36174.1 hypothetical protein KO02_05295 [Sphingobacterium sp. ML3W]